MKTPSNEKEISLHFFLKEARIRAGLSQREVAKKFGYASSQFISNWERGISEPPIPILKQLAAIYSIPSEELFNMVLSAAIQKVTRDFHRRAPR